MPLLDLIRPDAPRESEYEETKKPPDEWEREMRASFAPILHLPPKSCIAPSACSRLGPCDRHTDGQPCQIRNSAPS